MGFELGVPDRNAALEGVAALHDDSVIRVYAGTVPTSPGDSIGSATLLATFTESNDGSTPLTMAASAANGVLAKNSSESWEATVVASGTASFYRYSDQTDTGTESTTIPRVQGTCGVVNAELLFSTVEWTVSDEKRIDSYYWGQPENA